MGYELKISLIHYIHSNILHLTHKRFTEFNLEDLNIINLYGTVGICRNFHDFDLN